MHVPCAGGMTVRCLWLQPLRSEAVLRCAVRHGRVRDRQRWGRAKRRTPQRGTGPRTRARCQAGWQRGRCASEMSREHLPGVPPLLPPLLPPPGVAGSEVGDFREALRASEAWVVPSLHSMGTCGSCRSSSAPRTDVDSQDNRAGGPRTGRAEGSGQPSSAPQFGSSARPLCTCSLWVKRSRRATSVCHASWRLCALEQVDPIREQMEFTGTSTRSAAALVPCSAAALLKGLLGRSRLAACMHTYGPGAVHHPAHGRGRLEVRILPGPRAFGPGVYYFFSTSASSQQVPIYSRTKHLSPSLTMCTY